MSCVSGGSSIRPSRFGRSGVEFAASGTIASRVLSGTMTSKAKLAEAAQGMLFFSRNPIPTSLTQLEPAHVKEALQLFKAVLMYAGERPHAYPPAVAHQVLTSGHTHPELRSEIYLQIIKQLRNNPGADSRRRYWELLTLMLMTFAPGPGCDDYVHVFCKKQAEDGGQKLISLLHTLQYDGNKPPPTSPDEIPLILTGFTGREVSCHGGGV